MSPHLFQRCSTSPEHRLVFAEKWGDEAFVQEAKTEVLEAQAAKAIAALPVLEMQPLREFIKPIGKGARIKKWSVGITTAPRRVSTFATSLRSLIYAGWESPRIFAEPNSLISAEFAHLPVTQRDVLAGAWVNYFLGLQELLARDPDADAYLMVQDDVVFTTRDQHQNLREYLEESLWPVDDPGVVSLYTSSAYSRQHLDGWHKLTTWWRWGACAMIFPRNQLVDFLSTIAIQWRLPGYRKNGGVRNIDSAIGRWHGKRRRSAWFPVPSLCQHIGHTSTIWNRADANGRRKAADFVADRDKTIVRTIRNPTAKNDPCIFRSEKPIKTSTCGCEYSCSNKDAPVKNGVCKLRDCENCDFYA